MRALAFQEINMNLFATVWKREIWVLTGKVLTKNNWCPVVFPFPCFPVGTTLQCLQLPCLVTVCFMPPLSGGIPVMIAVTSRIFCRPQFWRISFMTSSLRRTFVKPSVGSLFAGPAFFSPFPWRAHGMLLSLDGPPMRRFVVNVPVALYFCIQIVPYVLFQTKPSQIYSTIRRSIWHMCYPTLNVPRTSIGWSHFVSVLVFARRRRSWGSWSFFSARPITRHWWGICYCQKLCQKLSLPGCRSTISVIVTVNQRWQATTVVARLLRGALRVHQLFLLNTMLMSTAKPIAILQT